MQGPMNEHQLINKIKAWLEEDMPYGDITSQNILFQSHNIRATFIAKEEGIICGIDIINLVFQTIDKTIIFEPSAKDGDFVKPGFILGDLSGPLDKILMGERLALNLSQRMSGIATMSHQYAQKVQGYPVRIVDTRKTTPGLRLLEKYAVRVGGCYNHRYGLSDAVMIKDNHIAGAGSMQNAVTQIRAHIPHTTKIEVEVESLEALKEALDLDVDIIMLDNMTNDMLRAAVAINQGKAILEASGNMTLDRILDVAKTGVDIISVGALTHSVQALDISLKFLP
ncbi:nicotinate-nucleotide pyrophosphorylase (quinolinate phosphoribosyltransferase) [Petrocella atlantisensis]|jgi:nicotinate-nucleotide pyrophosphorylase (carboxylating)|uniref:Probable nicotinate-nucleotide pyrophosphorylase [carboxylating] n=2 Tax=Petrocella atlantisensis TaxID=2173034 RepID=A0A3P7PRN3_9FIRM|nr:MAG: nicotinate-nucleotide diphosphorylase (carboxylating) [Firmicutes bacterium HGW-Firmicutes-5]VDN45851.1 nicotinate-nucleotide pyrophosphorylase (quinolinate phosphoribosyltransferase) [Petrocella atlantisensis]